MTRDLNQKPQRRLTNDVTDFKPKIIDEVLKPVQRRSTLNNLDNNDYNPMNEAINNNVKIEQISIVEVKNVALSTSVVADEVMTEEAASVSEIIPTYNINKDDIPSANGVIEETINAIEIELKPIEVEYVELAAPIEFEHKFNGNKNEDAVTVNHINETVLFDSGSKREVESPFDFTPKEQSHRVRDYDDKSDEPSLDNVLNKLSKYKSTFDKESNLKKAKSVAELDLGDAVKGKVHDIIVRMRSVDRSGGEKREVISVKERPRKKSVSEKIALFEVSLILIFSLFS